MIYLNNDTNCLQLQAAKKITKSCLRIYYISLYLLEHINNRVCDKFINKLALTSMGTIPTENSSASDNISQT